MANERLRSAIYSAGMTLDQISERIEVDTKTVERWVSKGRIPHRANRQRVALALGVEERTIWPEIVPDGVDPGGTASEILQIYPSRVSIPTETWVALMDGAEESIDILAFSGSFLHDAVPHFVERLERRAIAGVKVRLLFGDPYAAAVTVRGDEEGIGDSLRERCRLTWKYLRPLINVNGIEARRHGCTLYQSFFGFDDDMLVNQHSFGCPASQSPVLHLIPSPEATLLPTFRDAYERVWKTGNRFSDALPS